MTIVTEPNKKLCRLGDLRLGDYYLTKSPNDPALCMVILVPGSNAVSSVSLHSGAFFYDSPDHEVYPVKLEKVHVIYQNEAPSGKRC